LSLHLRVIPPELITDAVAQPNPSFRSSSASAITQTLFRATPRAPEGERKFGTLATEREYWNFRSRGEVKLPAATRFTAARRALAFRAERHPRDAEQREADLDGNDSVEAISKDNRLVGRDERAEARIVRALSA
jgi:hypothetical protein